jgi:hypothetical protein
MALTDKLSNIADAIRTKTDTTGKMTLTEMPDKILGIQTSEDLDTELTEQQQLISELKTTLETKAAGVTINNQDKTITENGTYTADSGYTGLGTVTVSVAPPPSDIDALIERSLTEIHSNAASVAPYTFRSYGSLVSVDFPLAESVGMDAFSNCESLKNANFPSVTVIGSQSFYSSGLISVDFPLLTDGNSREFQSCLSLMRVNMPLLKSISSYMFSGCNKLQTADFGSVTEINNYALTCGTLTRLILRSANICNLKNVNAFSSSYHILGTTHTVHNPEGLKDGYIYVPRNLVESYKAATNWSNFATQFRALEDYTVDGTTTGALDESKI